MQASHEVHGGMTNKARTASNQRTRGPDVAAGAKTSRRREGNCRMAKAQVGATRCWIHIYIYIYITAINDNDNIESY